MLPLRDQLPTRSPAVVNYLLIAANVLVFGLEASGIIAVSSDGRSIAGALVPAELVAHPVANLPRLVSHLFLQAGIGHLAGNMLFLWILRFRVPCSLSSRRKKTARPSATRWAPTAPTTTSTRFARAIE